MAAVRCPRRETAWADSVRQEPESDAIAYGKARAGIGDEVLSRDALEHRPPPGRENVLVDQERREGIGPDYGHVRGCPVGEFGAQPPADVGQCEGERLGLGDAVVERDDGAHDVLVRGLQQRGLQRREAFPVPGLGRLRRVGALLVEGLARVAYERAGFPCFGARTCVVPFGVMVGVRAWGRRCGVRR
ncbi:hypothetical protein [Embleya sp. MST-111070]|uniref:hypothetical protein n=1 Tax=Embleya sp. MST-111070 TaxID=3398231 RepID=UPI003F73AADA